MGRNRRLEFRWGASRRDDWFASGLQQWLRKNREPPPHNHQPSTAINQLRATEEDERRNPSAGAKIPPTVTLRAIAALNEQTLSLPQPESIIFTELDQEGASEFLPGACAQSDCGTASSHEPGERGMEPIFVSVPAVPPAALVLASELAASAPSSLAALPSFGIDASLDKPPEMKAAATSSTRPDAASPGSAVGETASKGLGIGPSANAGMGQLANKVGQASRLVTPRRNA